MPQVLLNVMYTCITECHLKWSVDDFVKVVFC